jgi:hypothetical protein
MPTHAPFPQRWAGSPSISSLAPHAAGRVPAADRRRDASGVWHLLPPRPCGPLAQGHPLEPAKARTSGSSARRSGHGALARGNLARHQQGPQAEQQSLLFMVLLQSAASARRTPGCRQTSPPKTAPPQRLFSRRKTLAIYVPVSKTQRHPLDTWRDRAEI